MRIDKHSNNKFIEIKVIFNARNIDFSKCM